jgi:hypothetical protein
MEQFNQPPINEEEKIKEEQTLKDGETAYWSGDGTEYTIDEEEEVGYDY